MPAAIHADLSTDEPDFRPGAEPLNRLSDKMTADITAKFQGLLATVPGLEEKQREVSGGATSAPAVQPAAALSATQPTVVPAVAQPVVVPAAIPDPSDDPFDDPSIPSHERPPSGAAKATKEHWMRFRAIKNAEVEAARKEKEALSKELEAARKAANGIPVSEHEALKQSHARAEAELERVALSRSERFRNHYDGGIARAIKLAKTAAGKHGVEVEGLLQNLTPEAEARLGEIRKDLGIRGNMLDKAASDILSLQIEREEQLSNSAENIKLLRAREATEAAEATQRDQQRRATLADSLVTSVSALPEFKADPADAAHSTFSKEALDFIRSATLGKLSAEDAALLPVAAMKAQYYQSIRLPKLEAELTALKERVAQLTGASPKLDGQQRGTGQVPNSKTALTAANYDPQKAVQEVAEKFRLLREGA